MKRALALFAFLATGGVAAAPVAKAPAPEYKLPADVTLLVPKNSVRVGWLLPPAKATTVPEVFDVDKQGNPWFGYRGRAIAHPLKGAILAVDDPFQSFAWTDDGGLLLTNGKSLGYLVGAHFSYEGAKPQRMMRTAFKPVIALPHQNARLFPGGSNSLFLAGLNPKTKKYEVVYIEIKNKIANVRTLLESDTPVNYVVGDRGKAWVAVGRVVAKVDLKAKTLEPVFAHSTEPIREFAYVPNLGFFYATASGLGFYKKNVQYQFMKGANLRMRLKGHKLYVLLDKGQGLLRLENLVKFGALTPPAKKS
jgi:hypothetical protein